MEFVKLSNSNGNNSCSFELNYPSGFNIEKNKINNKHINLEIRSEDLNIKYTLLVKNTTDRFYSYDFGPYPISHKTNNDSIALQNLMYNNGIINILHFERIKNLNRNYLISDVVMKNGYRYIQGDYTKDSLSIVFNAAFKNMNKDDNQYKTFLIILKSIAISCP